MSLISNSVHPVSYTHLDVYKRQHIVSGHIDGVGRITKISKDDNAVWYTINAGKEIMQLIVPKGSITIDGISLTVAGVDVYKRQAYG